MTTILPKPSVLKEYAHCIDVKGESVIFDCSFCKMLLFIGWLPWNIPPSKGIVISFYLIKMIFQALCPDSHKLTFICFFFFLLCQIILEHCLWVTIFLRENWSLNIKLPLSVTTSLYWYTKCMTIPKLILPFPFPNPLELCLKKVDPCWGQHALTNGRSSSGWSRKRVPCSN